MVESMTGFGQGEAEQNGLTATVEMRSVNNRYCEVSVHLPRELVVYETQIQGIVKRSIERGKIHVRVNVEQWGQSQNTLQLDEEAVQQYVQLLNQLRLAAGIEAPIGIEHVLIYADQIFKEKTTEPDALWPLVEEATNQAIEALVTMRKQEGDALKEDLYNHIKDVEQELAAVESRAPLRVEDARARLNERLEEILTDERIDETRLTVEIAILADRIDISEECVRLHSHLSLFREALDSPESVGRKLNFLVQEMNREINTIGSKANDAIIAHNAVKMKEALEKIREQVQNVQ